MNRKNNRKLVPINTKRYSKSDINRHCVSKYGGERSLIGCKICVVNEGNSLGWYVKEEIESLVATVRNRSTIPRENEIHLKAFRKQDGGERLNN